MISACWRSARSSSAWASRSFSPAGWWMIAPRANYLIHLDEIATGPTTQVGLGKKFAQHDHLDFVLQALPRLPNRGWAFIKAGMRSPTIRNRNRAIRALASWTRGDWPVEANAYVRKCESEKPDEKLKGQYDALLAGKPLERQRVRPGSMTILGTIGAEALLGMGDSRTLSLSSQWWSRRGELVTIIPRWSQARSTFN